MDKETYDSMFAAMYKSAATVPVCEQSMGAVFSYTERVSCP